MSAHVALTHRKEVAITALCLLLIGSVALLPFVRTFGLFFDHTDEFGFLYHLPLSEYGRLFVPHWNFYRPLPEAFWLLEYRLFDVEPFGYRIVAWLKHLLVLYAVFALALALAQDRFLATAAALLVSQRPELIDTVARIGGGIETLFTLPYILSILAYWLFRRRRNWWLLALSLALAAVSLLSKEMAISIPLAILALELAFGNSGVPVGKRILRAIRRSAPFIGLTATYSALFILRPFWPRKGQIAIFSGVASAADWAARNATALFGSILSPLWLVAPVVAISTLLLWRRAEATGTPDRPRRVRQTLLFSLGLVIVSPLPVVALPIVLEKHTYYLPSIAAALLCAAALTALVKGTGRHRRALAPVGMAILLLVLFTNNTELRAGLSAFMDRITILGSIPRSVASRIDLARPPDQICLVFRPGKYVKSIETEVMNFWVVATRFVLHDAVDVICMHDFLRRKFAAGIAMPSPQYWLCQDGQARPDPSIDSLVARLEQFRKALSPGLTAPGEIAGRDSTVGPQPARSAISWDFTNKTLNGWTVTHGRSSLEKGYLELFSDDQVAKIVSPPISLHPWLFSCFEIEAKCDPIPASIRGRMLFKSGHDRLWPKWKRAVFEFQKDGAFHSNFIFTLEYFPWISDGKITRIMLVMENLLPGTAIRRITLSPAIPPGLRVEFPNILPIFAIKEESE